jgi:hypothetical protein
MLFPLKSSYIHLKDICLRIFSLHSICGLGIFRVICADRKDVDVVLLSVLLCMLNWFLHFSTLSN